MRAIGIAAALAVAVACTGCGGTKAPSAPAVSGTLISPAATAPAFTLTDQTGHAVSMSSERGRWVVVTFLYTHCPDVCPVIAGTLNRVLQTPVAHQAGLRVLAVSVDPKGDTKAAVQRFVRVHQLVPAFHYLTGSRAVLRPVWTGFHVASTAGPGATVSHTAVEFLIDPTGRERVVYDSSVTATEVVRDLTLLDARK